MPDLVLDPDPRTTKVRAKWSDGTETDAGIYWSDGSEMHGWYLSRRGFRVCFSVEISLSSDFYPLIINAPEEPPEMETVEEMVYVNVYPHHKAQHSTERQANEHAAPGAIAVAVPFVGKYQKPKPKPPEPAVLEGTIFDANENTNAITVAASTSGKKEFVGRKCTLTIH